MERRVESTTTIDAGFLFVLACELAAFEFLNAMVGGRNAVLAFIPLLIYGIAYPFYVGFIRATAVFRGVLLERARGWVSLMTGIAFYSFFTAAAAGGFLAIPVLIACGWLTIQTARWFSRSTGIRFSVSELNVLGATAGATLFLAVPASIFEFLSAWWVKDFVPSESIEVGLAIFLISFPIFVIVERVIRRIVVTGGSLSDLFEGENGSADSAASRERFAALRYLLSGSIQCVIIGFRSDLLATGMFWLSYPLVFGLMSWTFTGILVGVLGLLLLCCSGVRFLRCEIRLDRS